LIAPGDLKVTDGTIETSNGRLLVNVPEMRAVLRAPAPQLIEVRFTYLGPTATTSALGNGEVRRQFGVKLNAQDSCNLLHVMWRTAPNPGIVVSMKRNPGVHSFSQCHDGGYTNLIPASSGHVPTLQPGSSHILRAGIEQRDLRVRIDDQLMWEGTLPLEATLFDGPVGLRSDNVRVTFDVLVSR
jgi:hypothetical protein